MSEPIQLPDLTYFVPVHDPAENRWLTVAVNVGGDASVIGRWTTKQLAEDDASRWHRLELEATS